MHCGVYSRKYNNMAEGSHKREREREREKTTKMTKVILA